MSELEVLHHPNPRLKAKAALVGPDDGTIPALAEEMLKVMYRENGIGLAATQIGVPKRVMVIDLSEERNRPLFFVNLEITDRSGTVESREGCLSVPGVFDHVPRSRRLSARAHLLNPGEWMDTELDFEALPETNPEPVWGGHGVRFDCGGLLAICIQHEVDHLDGKLFIDRLSELKRDRLLKKYAKKQTTGANL